ncbi:unnamed protein product [Nesidiocoris tenuis]|uniref:RRM domain-containing protein n=1 Tax=Nesidiocoris tenuis TaxID=355587 RepID=A0A6H5GWR5_9HEMI|nr:unnamed protein product [Nesidiocoris tenuis]
MFHIVHRSFYRSGINERIHRNVIICVVALPRSLNKISLTIPIILKLFNVTRRDMMDRMLSIIGYALTSRTSACVSVYQSVKAKALLDGQASLYNRQGDLLKLKSPDLVLTPATRRDPRRTRLSCSSSFGLSFSSSSTLSLSFKLSSSLSFSPSSCSTLRCSFSLSLTHQISQNQIALVQKFNPNRPRSGTHPKTSHRKLRLGRFGTIKICSNSYLTELLACFSDFNSSLRTTNGAEAFHCAPDNVVLASWPYHARQLTSRRCARRIVNVCQCSSGHWLASLSSVADVSSGLRWKQEAGALLHRSSGITDRFHGCQVTHSNSIKLKLKLMLKLELECRITGDNIGRAYRLYVKYVTAGFHMLNAQPVLLIATTSSVCLRWSKGLIRELLNQQPGVASFYNKKLEKVQRKGPFFPGLEDQTGLMEDQSGQMVEVHQAPNLTSPSRSSPHSQGSESGERYSRKVFVGGLPPDIDEGQIVKGSILPAVPIIPPFGRDRLLHGGGVHFRNARLSQ